MSSITAETDIRGMWVNLGTQGTAMGETALCDDCQHAGTNALDFALMSLRQDDTTGRTFRTRVANESLTCQVCAATAATA